LIKAGSLTLDEASRIAWMDGLDGSAVLTGAECAVLAALMDHAGRVVRAEALQDAMAPLCRGDGPIDAVVTLRVILTRLRNKLAVIGVPREAIASAYNEGYRLSYGSDGRTALLLSSVERAALRTLIAQCPPHARHAADVLRVAMERECS
jgi:DNA-binding response OmpR family regulator